MWRKIHLPAWANGVVFVLRIFCLFSVCYGFYNQTHDRYFVILNKQRYGGTFEFLTMIAAVCTVFTMACGLIATIIKRGQKHHMHFVSILLPVEAIVTIYSWTMYIFFREGILSPEAKAVGYLEFNALNHYCLHLMPFIGLLLDFISEMDYYEYKAWQGCAIIVFGGGYFLWLIFLKFKNKRWVYHALSYLSAWQMALLLVATCTLSIIFWRIVICSSRRVFKHKDATKRDKSVEGMIENV